MPIIGIDRWHHGRVPGPLGSKHNPGHHPPGPLGTHRTRQEAPLPGATVVLWIYTTLNDNVWRLTAENEFSFVAALRIRVAKETGWDMRSARFIHITHISQIEAALKGPISRVVWVGHVVNVEDDRSGIIVLEDNKGGMEGDEFAKLLPKKATVKFLACKSTGIAAQMKSVSPALEIHSSSHDHDIVVDFDDNQIVRKVSFVISKHKE